MGVWQNFTQLGKNFIDAGNIRCFASSTNMFIETLSYIKPHFEFSNAFDVFQKSLQDAYNSHQLNSKNSLCWEEALHLMSVALKGTQSKIIFKPDREVFKNVKKAFGEARAAWDLMGNDAQDLVESNGLSFRGVGEFNADHFIGGILNAEGAHDLLDSIIGSKTVTHQKQARSVSP